MRLFLAVDIPADATAAIVAEQKRIAAKVAAADGALRLLRPDQLHLTLLFIAAVEETRVADVINAINQPVDVSPFDAAFGGAGVFPDRGAPRVLWIGVTEGAATLARLQSEIARRIRALG